MLKILVFRIICTLIVINFLGSALTSTVKAADCLAWLSTLDPEVPPGASLTATIQNADSGKTYRFSLTPVGASGIPVVSQDAVATGSTLEITITTPTEERRYFYSISKLRSDGTPENCDVGGSGFIEVTSSAIHPTSSPSPPNAGTNPCDPNCETAIGNFSTNPIDFVGQVLTIATGLAGGIAFILMVVGAIRVLTSTGNPQNVNAGRDMIVAALAGLIFIILSVLILKFIGVNIFGGGLNPFS